MKNIFTFCFIAAVSLSHSFAQDRSSVYTNLLNPYIYNPALAGSNDNIYAILNLRGISGGVDGGNRSYNFGIHSPIGASNGLGAKVLSVSAGVFQTMNAEVAYSKFVKLSNKSTFKLGLSVGFMQTNLKTDLLNRQVDLSDPALNSNDLNKMKFSSGLGMQYKFDKKLEVGLAFPMLVTGDKPLNNMVVANAGWNFFTGTNKDWKIKPMVNYYQLNSSPSMVDVLAQVAWKEMVSVSAGYRSNGAMLSSVGLNFKTFGIYYAYYNQLSGINSLAPVQNELAVAFSFNKPKPRGQAGSEIVSDEVIQDEIDKINERLTGLINIEKTNPGLINMKKESSKLNKDLGKVLSKYKITNSAQIEKIKSLQQSLESIISKYND